MISPIKLPALTKPVDLDETSVSHYPDVMSDLVPFDRIKPESREFQDLQRGEAVAIEPAMLSVDADRHLVLLKSLNFPRFNSDQPRVTVGRNQEGVWYADLTKLGDYRFRPVPKLDLSDAPEFYIIIEKLYW